jgi:hypothetical protein
LIQFDNILFMFVMNGSTMHGKCPSAHCILLSLI